MAIPPSADIQPSFLAPAQVDDPIGLYIHVPFCAHICPYCDFNTFAGQSDLIPRYVTAVLQEIQAQAQHFQGRWVSSIFLGGGTPSQLAPSQLAEIVRGCDDAFDVLPDAEVTMEANPNDLDEAYCAGALQAGINRLSIGAQTLDRRGLRTLGRLHEAGDVGAALAAARGAGFSNVSLDLIYGWPGQTLAQWDADLQQVLASEVGNTTPDHLSLYSLIVEPGTPMADAVTRGILTPVDDDLAADFYELAVQRLDQAGWRHYEIANWARKPEFFSRHNAIYWRNGDYAGIGAGAHGHHHGVRRMNQPSPQRYIATLAANESPQTNSEQIDQRTAIGETMMLGLRLLEDGVSTAAFRARFGLELRDLFQQELARLSDLGLIAVSHERVRLTDRGALLANSVCAEFLAA